MEWKRANAVDPYTGKPTEVEYRSGEKEYRTYACCGLVSQTSKEGVVTEYLRDPNDVLKRVYCTKTTYPDGGGTVKDTVKFDGLSTTTTRKLGSVSFLASESVRHLNGELLSTKSPDANGDGTPETTTYLPVTLVTLPGNVTLGEIRTTKHPDHSDGLPSTTVTESYRDGRTKSITGEAVANVAYNYGVNLGLSYGSNPGFKATFTLTTRLTATGGISEWTEESRDPLQRSVQTKWSGTTPVATRTYFSTTAAAGSRGRLASATDADGVTVTYTYNPRGEPATTTTPHPGPLGTGGTRVETVARDVIPTITPLPGQTFPYWPRLARDAATGRVTARYLPNRNAYPYPITAPIPLSDAVEFYAYYGANHPSAGLLWVSSKPQAQATTPGLDTQSDPTYYSYNERGQLTHQWGAGTYPQRNVYDALGRQIELHTWRTAGGNLWNAST